MRIVSLLPSATEIVCELGFGDQLVGVTHECDWPPFVRDLPKVTNTLIPVDASSAEIDRLVRERLSNERALYSLDYDAVEKLRPDLIVTQALCDVCAVAEAEVREAACRLPGAPRVINLEPETLSEVLDSHVEVAKAIDDRDAGVAARARLQKRIDTVVQRSFGKPPVATVVLEWIDPPFSAGHWVPEIIRLAGGHEIIGRDGEKSRTLTWADVIEARPDALFISCCGFTHERAREDTPIMLEAFAGHDLPCLETGRVFILDGSAHLSRPGPRLVEALEIIAHAIDPDRHPAPRGVRLAERL
jgi:iron complex transport system substrate-binding protein